MPFYFFMPIIFLTTRFISIFIFNSSFMNFFRVLIQTA
jgi:hypothetical protein